MKLLCVVEFGPLDSLFVRWFLNIAQNARYSGILEKRDRVFGTYLRKTAASTGYF